MTDIGADRQNLLIVFTPEFLFRKRVQLCCSEMYFPLSVPVPLTTRQLSVGHLTTVLFSSSHFTIYLQLLDIIQSVLRFVKI